MRRLTQAVLAGAAGTVAIEAASYLDMVMRGRAPSDTPERVVARLAERAGANELAAPNDAQMHRRSGIGALFGFATGISTALFLSPIARRRFIPLPVAAVLLGGAAMAASDVTATKLGVTDPSTWGAEGWLADALPHLAYGMTAAAVLKAKR